MNAYVADFETTTPKDGETATTTRVWAYGVCEVGNEENFVYGTDIEKFIEWCAKGENKTVYFHNLKFDMEFLFHWMEMNGYKHSDGKEDKTYNVTISGMGQAFKVEIIFKKLKKKYKKVTIYDSYKKLPFTVARIAKAFKLDILKGTLDYSKERDIDHVITDDELAYLKNDVQIVAKALNIQFEQGLTKMTVGSDALTSFKNIMGKNVFDYHFPVLPLDVDDDIRCAYKGGFTYVNERYAEMDVKDGLVYDVTSLYPSVMRYEMLPYDYPEFFEGKYVPDDMYPLYIQVFSCEFELKDHHIPTVQLKNQNRFVQTEYLKSNVDKEGFFEPVTLVMTNVDMELFFEHYVVTNEVYHEGYKFKAAHGMFDEYIDHWVEVKEKATEEGNGAIRELAKLMLNSLYGKFATNPIKTGKYPILEDGVIRYEEKDDKIDKPVYTAMGCFITSYARRKTISSAQSVYHRFAYADTDSLHILGSVPPSTIEIGDKLGQWKFEGAFTRARFVRPKTYIEEMDGELHVTCAGMPDNVKKLVTWENFRVYNHDMFLPARDGYFYGKLIPKRIWGGVILCASPFTIN